MEYIESYYSPQKEEERDFYEQNSEKIEVAKKSFYPFMEMWNEKDNSAEFLIKDLIARGVVTIFGGIGGIGKTRILTQLALSVGFGRNRFLGREMFCKAKRSLVVNTEEGVSRFAQACQKQLKGIESPEYVPTLENHPHLDFIDTTDHDHDSLLELIHEKLLKFEYDLIVMDSLTDMVNSLANGEINSDKDVNRVIDSYAKLAEKYQVAIIIIHHPAKSKMDTKKKAGSFIVESNDLQGSGRIVSKARVIAALSHDYDSNIDFGKEKTLEQQAQEGHFNYLHIVKENIMSSGLNKWAMKLFFNKQYLTHEYIDTVKIDGLNEEKKGTESNEKIPSTSSGTSAKHLAPEKISLAAHRSKINNILLSEDVYESEFEKQVINSYGITKTVYRRSYRKYLIDENFILIAANKKVLRGNKLEPF